MFVCGKVTDIFTSCLLLCIVFRIEDEEIIMVKQEAISKFHCKWINHIALSVDVYDQHSDSHHLMELLSEE